ncbi:MAG: galactose mutarotase [Spirochaetaceae bacterium]|jgi:aldose 1-epimerase|nr:galactose mutarotase [Spirochaetaceae bacterium]
MKVEETKFGITEGGEEVSLFRIHNTRGVAVELISYGAAIKSVRTPDTRGVVDEITYGFDTLGEYEKNRFFFGATVGRFGNRIAGGAFVLDGKSYTLAKNNGPNHLHGGPAGFDRRVWKGTPSSADGTVTFCRASPAGEESYPGNVDVKVSFTLRDSNELVIDYWARTDGATPFNPTNHAYWNLGGTQSPSILDEELLLYCPWYLPVRDDLIPTGEILSVKNTPMDFTQPKKIGRDIDSVKPAGYDHCFVIESGGEGLKKAALLRDGATGRTMEVLTTMPGIQVYSGNNITGAPIAGGRRAVKRGAICLETECFPDSVNRRHFPSAILKPGETFSSRTVYRFDC